MKEMKKIIVNLIVALINATMLLIVAALILLVVLLNKFETFSETVTANMTRGIMSEAGAPIETLITEIETIDKDINTLNATLQNLMEDPKLSATEEIVPQLQMMNEQVTQITSQISQTFQSADDAFKEINQSINELSDQLGKIDELEKMFKNQILPELGVMVTQSLFDAFQCRAPNKENVINRK